MHSHITPSTFDATEYLIRALTGWRPKGKRSKQERKMDMRKYAGESFIRVDNVRNGSLQERIALVKEGKYERPDIVFESGDILTLNTTNARILIKNYGPSSDDWFGKDVDLTLGTVAYQGKEQESVVIRPISPPMNAADRQAASAKMTAAATNEIDDEIPF
jgi:hypothetical protein